MDEPDETLEEYLNRIKGKKITYKCTVCGEIFDDEGDLGMHLMWGHNLGEEIVE